MKGQKPNTKILTQKGVMQENNRRKKYKFL
jgi:hypothetical protein